MWNISHTLFWNWKISEVQRFKAQTEQNLLHKPPSKMSYQMLIPKKNLNIFFYVCSKKRAGGKLKTCWPSFRMIILKKFPLEIKNIFTVESFNKNERVYVMSSREATKLIPHVQRNHHLLLWWFGRDWLQWDHKHSVLKPRQLCISKPFWTVW